MLTSKQLRAKFLEFMAIKGHAILPSASVIPKEDPTLLFVNSGMYPLVPYLMGQYHPDGTRLADSQKCIRTLDIEEVGDNRHLSLFEMLGSWSLGDYSKADSIRWGYEFLTSADWLGLDPHRLFVTVYKGNEMVPTDQIAIDTWTECFAGSGIVADLGTEFDFGIGAKVTGDDKYIYRITKKSGKDNWWGLPYRGPCGPCSEIYYLMNSHSLDFESSFESMPLVDIENFIENQIVEIWNHVFMEYIGEWGEGKEPVNLVPLENKNVDTGMGFERALMVLNGYETVHQTDCLDPLVQVANRWNRVGV